MVEVAFRLKRVRCPNCGFETEVLWEVYSSLCPSCDKEVVWEELPEAEVEAEEEAEVRAEVEPLFPFIERLRRLLLS